MKWTVGSFADEQWLQFGLWGIGASFPRKYNWCHLPRICCDISGTLLMLKAMHASQNWGKISTFKLPENFSTLLQCIFSLKTFGKVIKAKAVAVHANWQISCTSSKPNNPNFVNVGLTVYLSQPDTHSVIHPSRCWFQNKNLLYQNGVRSKESSQFKSPVKKKTKLFDKKTGRWHKKPRTRGKTKLPRSQIT